MAAVVRDEAHRAGRQARHGALLEQGSKLVARIEAFLHPRFGFFVLLGYLMTVATCVYFGVLIWGAWEAGSLILGG